MKKSINKIISIIVLISIVTSSLPIGTINAYVVKPSIAISIPSKTTVNAGGSVSYTITYTDVDEIYLSSSYVSLNGFSADVYVSKNGNTRTITLSNIQGSNGNKNISIKANSAVNDAGYASATPNSYSFNLINNDVNSTYTDKVGPSISISQPNNLQVYEGGTVVYTVSFADNVGISRINLSSSYIVLNGFNANVSVSGSGKIRMITLSNIQGTAGKKNIGIRVGAAEDAACNKTIAIGNSVSFELVKKAVQPKPTTVVKPNNKNNAISNKNQSANTATDKKVEFVKSTPKITSTCNDNLSVLGDINKNVKTFSTWFSSQKENAKYISQNNYVAKNEITTYFVDYYNGNKDTAKGVKIKVTIPYNVDVLEINSNGYIKSQTAQETVIEWDKSSIQSEARCRLQVKVKYLQNASLENSDKLSQDFYVKLETESNLENNVSYLRQLFIDVNSNKKATINKYLSSIDNTNSIRPEDKITRAELAKLLVDSGVVELKQGNEDYKKYKDADEVPSYARDAISAMYSTDIIEKFSDSEFKPNNPIVRDEFFKIVAKASQHISKGKITIGESPFVYTNDIDDDDKTLTDNTKYIMELIRQNVISRGDANPDEYILRKDAVEIINALTFRGPYVEDLGDNKVKFVDISKDSRYFYNIIAAATTYTYNYTKDLNQQILELK